ncbi:zinc finger protein ZFAT isoform X2 [Mastacembelus armatus]|uniref:zinc finger protein ZFAT isoform X2 n=1 Tax=Mastacembelus armatus TaxID=205130 RepID=UPI000E455584|nr:zinc finger protein ZFAT isoform X2 [Mastacembelus armatus]
MDGQVTVFPAGSVFMCRLCNLFSPSRSQLLTHCSQLHPEQEPPDDIITTLKPLVAEPVETLAVKRKRGRPKGSTKKTHLNLREGKADSTPSPEGKVQREEENKDVVDLQGESNERTAGLECRSCHRSFSNRRQILKHICLREKDEEEDEEDNGSICGRAGVEGSEDLDHGGTDSNRTHQNSGRRGLFRDKDSSSFKFPRINRSRISKDGGPAAENKKSVISVVLMEDEALPGVSKMVPVEDSSTETESVPLPQPSAVFQSQSHDLASDATSCEGNTKTDQELSCNPTSTTTAAATASRGFQEYSIKQDAAKLLQSQLKIFACEFCNKIFKFRHSLIAHLRIHTQEKPFQCPQCDYASAIKANLNVHLRKHTGEKFNCQYCPFNCLSPGHLKVHTERVHLKVKQHCSFCDKKYSDVKNLLKHMEKRHNMKDPAVYQSFQQLRLKTRQGLRQLLYHCPTCNRRFKNQLERERHLLVHGPQRPFACFLCDHAATKMATLTDHVRKHLFVYMCCVCDGKFVSSQKLKSHLKQSHPELDQEQAFTSCINNSYHLIQPGGDMWGDEEKADMEKRMNREHRIEQESENERQEKGRRNGVGGEGWRDGEIDELLQVAAQEQQREDSKSLGGSSEEAQVREGATGKKREFENEGTQKGSKEALQEMISTEIITSSERQDEATAEEKSRDNTPDSHTENICRQEENTHTSLSADGTQENTHPPDEAKNTHSLSGNPDLSEFNVQTPLPSAPSGEEGGPTPRSEKESEVFHQSAFQQVFSSLQKTRLNMETFQRLRKIYGDLECQYCGKLFWYKVHYNVHIRTHTKEHSHYCSKCNYSSITKSSLKRHQIQKHSDLLLPCSNPGCKYTTPDKYKLQAHLRTHQGKGNSVTCPVCQHSYPEHRLKHHIRTSHPDTLPAQGKGLMVQRAEKCPYCDSCFLKNSSDFQQHIWAHQGLRPYVCSVCDYAGRSRSNLKTHMNRHNTERRHLCDLCGKKFKSKVTLKSHGLSHTNEGKRFQCSECDFTSVSKPSLLRHMEQHAEFKPFRCAHCHYSCNIAGPLKRHYNMKHPDQKYENAGPGLPNADALKQQGGLKCPECEFVYGTKWELNRHLKSKHSLKVVEGVWEVGEAIEAQYVSVEDEGQLTEAPAATLHDTTVNVQQITEFSSETHDAITSMVAMAPGTVTVVQQVANEQEVGNCSNQVMVVNAEGGLAGDQVMVVEDAHGLEALTLLTQGENADHYIVYVQEHTVEIN